MKKDIYIVAQYFQRPRPGVNTSQAGWQNNKDNVMYDERVQVTAGKKTNVHNKAHVIVNVTQRKVERNSLSGSGTKPNFWLTWNYFIKNNGKYIKDAMDSIDERAYTDVVAEIELMMHLAEKQAAEENNEPNVQTEEEASS